MSNNKGSDVISVSFSILGDNFTLRCREDQKEQLENAIESVQTLTARILRDNPTINPQQAAILCALESQSKLQQFLGTSTPFSKKADAILNRIYKNLNHMELSVNKLKD